MPAAPVPQSLFRSPSRLSPLSRSADFLPPAHTWRMHTSCAHAASARSGRGCIRSASSPRCRFLVAAPAGLLLAEGSRQVTVFVPVLRQTPAAPVLVRSRSNDPLAARRSPSCNATALSAAADFPDTVRRPAYDALRLAWSALRHAVFGHRASATASAA